MRLIIIACVVVFVYSKYVKGENCDGIHINHKFHRKEIFTKNFDRSYQLSYDKYRHRVYFSYNIGKDEEGRFGIGYIESGQLEHRVKENIDNGYATAIDDLNHKIYFGGSLGIYEESLKEGNETKQIVNGFNIWDMFFKKELYFISYPQLRLYKCLNEGTQVKVIRQKHIDENIFLYAVDGHEDSFITNETGLYLIRNGTTDRILLDQPTNNYRCIEVNNRGVAHFCGKDAIYIVNKTNHTLEKIADIRNIFGLTFDENDNIIYSNPYEIVKLVPGDCK